MSGKLYFHLTLSDNPYKEDKLDELWGNIKLIYELNNSIINLLDWEWNIKELQEWFESKKEYLLTRNLNVLNEDNKSIAEVRDIAYNREFFFNEDEQHNYYNMLEDVFLPFQFHLRGTPTPVYYIGINNGMGEISYFDEIKGKYERYNFDMEFFLISTEVVLRVG